MAAGEQDTIDTERVGYFVIMVGVSYQEHVVGAVVHLLEPTAAVVEFAVGGVVVQADEADELAVEAEARDCLFQQPLMIGGEH